MLLYFSFEEKIETDDGNINIYLDVAAEAADYEILSFKPNDGIEAIEPSSVSKVLGVQAHKQWKTEKQLKRERKADKKKEREQRRKEKQRRKLEKRRKIKSQAKLTGHMTKETGQIAEVEVLGPLGSALREIIVQNTWK